MPGRSATLPMARPLIPRAFPYAVPDPTRKIKTPRLEADSRRANNPKAGSSPRSLEAPTQIRSRTTTEHNLSLSQAVAAAVSSQSTQQAPGPHTPAASRVSQDGMVAAQEDIDCARAAVEAARLETRPRVTLPPLVDGKKALQMFSVSTVMHISISLPFREHWDDRPRPSMLQLNSTHFLRCFHVVNYVVSMK